MTPDLASPEMRTLIETRRDLHRYPELGFEEHRTAGIVAERLRSAGFEVREGIASTGVVGTMRGGAGDGPSLLLRADMDALPIQELAAHDFASEIPGKMHACGHDAHVAIGLAVAERLARRRIEWPGTIHYLFQPAEEGGGGALRMVEEGVMDGIDAALGLHVWMDLDSGTVGVVEGPMMAGAREFSLLVQGRGGHGAIPQETVDAVMVASQIIVSAQTIIARNTSPLDTAVLTFGTFNAGNSPNIIADSATIQGTIRAYSMEVMEAIQGRLQELAQGLASSFGASCEVTFGERLYPPTINHPEMAELVARTARDVVGEDRLRLGPDVRTMAAEDFSEYGLRAPACYFFLGIRDVAEGIIHPHHSPHFTVSEPALPIGVEVLERAALEFLQTGRRPSL